jgi:hypothetical protein
MSNRIPVLIRALAALTQQTDIGWTTGEDVLAARYAYCAVLKSLGL